MILALTGREQTDEPDPLMPFSIGAGSGVTVFWFSEVIAVGPRAGYLDRSAGSQPQRNRRVSSLRSVFLVACPSVPHRQRHPPLVIVSRPRIYSAILVPALDRVQVEPKGLRHFWSLTAKRAGQEGVIRPNAEIPIVLSASGRTSRCTGGFSGIRFAHNLLLHR